MLQILETKSDRHKAQRQLVRSLRGQMENLGDRIMGFPGGNLTTQMHSLGQGRLFFAHFKTDGVGGIERYWNAFGLFDDSRSSQDITVEINIAVESLSQQVAAFFARDTDSGRIYILHSGRVGGGHEGVGRNAFLAWSKNRLVPSYDRASRPARLGVLLGPIDDVKISARIERFVRQVANFKNAVRQDEINPNDLKTNAEEIDRYKSEFSGEKRGQRSSLEVEYLCSHGEIVDALQLRRDSVKKDNEFVGNNRFIDLYVKKSGLITEIYEVKTSTERQSLYGAIGQLAVHGNITARPMMSIVLPLYSQIHTDISAAFSTMNIQVLHYEKNRQNDAYDFFVKKNGQRVLAFV